MSDEKVKSKKSKATFQAGCKSPIEIDLQFSEAPLEEKPKQSRRSTSRGRNPTSKQVQIESERKPEPERVPVDLEESFVSFSLLEKNGDEEEQQVPNKPKKKSPSKAKMRESFFRMGDMKENIRWPFYVIKENWLSILLVGFCCMYVKGIQQPSNVDVAPSNNRNPTTTNSLAIDEMQIDLLPLIGIKTDLRFVHKLLEGRLNENETVMKISDVELPTIESILGHMKYLENLIAQKKKVEEAVAAAQPENAEKSTEKQSESNSPFSNETINSVSETIKLAEAIAHITQSIKTLQEQVEEMKQRQHQTGAKGQETLGLTDEDGMKNELEENKATPKPEAATSPVPSAEKSSHLKKQKQLNQSLVQTKEHKSSSISAM